MATGLVLGQKVRVYGRRVSFQPGGLVCMAAGSAFGQKGRVCMVASVDCSLECWHVWPQRSAPDWWAGVYGRNDRPQLIVLPLYATQVACWACESVD